MKKLLLLTAVAAFGLSSVNAQEVQFGAKAGVNLATMTGDIEDNSSKVGFHLGGVAEIKISDKFSVQPELIFSQQGTKSETKESGESMGFSYNYEEETKVKANYLNLPIMAKFYVAEGLSLEAGPQVGFLLSADAEYEYKDTETFGGVTTTDSGSAEADVKDAYKGIDFGIGFGAGYKLDNGLNFGLRYNLGLSSVAEDETYEDGFGNTVKREIDVKNNVLQFSVGYMF